MKKILLITLVTVFLYQVSTSQNNAKIDIVLQQEMLLRNASELIGINIILNQQYDQMDLRMKSSIFIGKEAKRTFVVGELKRFSGETQQDVMSYLKLLLRKGQVSNIQSHWIYNGIYCHAAKNVIEELATFDDILIIGFDKQYKLSPDDKKTDIIDVSREITYNVLKVNADQVWDLGYTGEGVIVAVADCGVNYNHYDLKNHMWEHSDFPYHGWNFVFNNNDPMDLEGHGTHCAGTVAGDGTAGSQTGMAPKATIMALKVWDDRIGLGSANNMSSGFAFAVEHGAHVISMSGGVPQMFITDVDRILLRNTMVNVLKAGVIAAVAAGNENGWYSPPNTVRCPSSCPPPWLHPDQTTTGGKSCVMSVGATDINDNIASFSSIGPVTWQTIVGYNDYFYNPGMGLIRPDVCAPGVNIKSLDYANPEGYTKGWNGTSMATPCVAGIIALMLSKNIDFTPAEICEILETTAVHLPNQSSPKGNIFGSGRIDAYAAVLKAQCIGNSTIVNNEVINTNTKWNTPVYATGNITIASGATLTINSTVRCEENVQFIVQSGGKLVVNGGTLTNACNNKLWQGIAVSGNSAQSQQPQYQGTVELKGAVIENAICAVTVRAGGIVTSENTDFRNNLSAIVFFPYVYIDPKGLVYDNVGSFKNCTFTIDNNNLFNSNGVTFSNHIKLNSVKGIKFIGCEFYSYSGGKGIFAEDAGFNVKEYCTVITQSNCACPERYSTPSHFENLTNAIYSNNTGNPYKITVDQSIFDNNLTSIYINSSNNYQVTRNAFKKVIETGLKSESSSGYKIEENIFEGGVVGKHVGILVSNSGYGENRIYKNSFKDFTYGISANLINSNITIQSLLPIPTMGLQFLCNDFILNNIDIIVNPKSDIRYLQGSLDCGSDNSFINTKQNSLYLNNLHYLIYFHSLISANYIPYNTFYNGNLTIIPKAQPNGCASSFCNLRGGYDEHNIEEQQKTYQNLQNVYDNLVNEFKELGYDYILENLENEIFTAEIITEMFIFLGQIDEVSNTMREISDNSISSIMQDSIMDINMLKSWHEIVRTPIAKYSLAETHLFTNDYAAADAVLYEIPAMFNFGESEYAEFNNYLQFHNFKKKLQLSERTYADLDETEISYLQTIAEANTGRSSTMAKGVLCFFYDICYEDDIEFEEPIKPKSTFLIPDEIKLDDLINENLDNIEKIEIYDMTGRKQNIIVNSLLNLIQYPIVNLPSGLYIAKIYTKDLKVISNKFIVK